MTKQLAMPWRRVQRNKRVQSHWVCKTKVGEFSIWQRWHRDGDERFMSTVLIAPYGRRQVCAGVAVAKRRAQEICREYVNSRLTPPA